MPPPPVIRLHPDDNVVIARVSLMSGAPLADNAAAVQRIPAGHKAAIRPIATGEAIRRYGQIIGFASSDIASGQHVHVQNCEMGDFAKDYAYGVDAKDTAYFNQPATFQGIRRPDGPRRDHWCIGILTSVNCSAHVAGPRRQHVPAQSPSPAMTLCRIYPNVDGVVAADPQNRLRHDPGRSQTCACSAPKPLAGYARHPNFSPCHRSRSGLRGQSNRRPDAGTAPRRPAARSLDIQTVGGTRKTVAAGVDFVREDARRNLNYRRIARPVPLSAP